MNTIRRRDFARLLILMGVLSLSACGGGSDDDTNNPPANQSPTANAGADKSADAGTEVGLTGSGSDADGSIAGYAWSQTAGAAVTLIGADGQSPAFTAPDVDAATTLTFQLTVTDDEGATANDTVNVEVAPVIAMSGRVYDGPLANATVTVTVGDRTYNATADADGNYTVNVGSVDPAALITISAVGGEGQEHVELLSIAASFATLQTAAGDDGVLEDGESGAVNVTNLSTARAVLMIEANGGAAITSEEQVTEAEKNVNGDEMIRLATVIKLVVDGGFDLPEGVASTADLVADEETTAAFIETVNAQDADAYQQIQDAMLSDPELLDTYDEADVPPAYSLLLVNTLQSTGVSEYMFNSRGPRYEFAADGTGELFSSDSDNSGAFAWEIIDGEIAMTFATPLVSQGFCNVEGVVQQVYCESTTETRNLRLIVDGIEADQLRMRSVGQTTYPDNPEITQPVAFDDTGSWVALESQMMIDFDDEETGTWALAVAGPDLTGLGVDALSAGLMIFNEGDGSGTGSTLASDFAPALAFTWEVVNDGSVEIDFADGSALTVRGLRREGIAYDAQLSFTTAEGDVYTDAGLVVRNDGSVDGLLPEDYSAFYTLFSQHPFFSIILKDDGTALNRDYDLDGNFFDTPITWALDEDGDVVMSYYWNVVTDAAVASCDGLPEPDCFVWRQRIWTPVAFDDAKGRVFVHETQVNYNYDDAQPGNQGAANFVQTSVRFWGYSETSLDGDAVLGKAGAPAADVRRKPWVKPPFQVKPLEE